MHNPAPLLAYLSLVALSAHGLARMTDRARWLQALPIAFYLPLVPALLLDAFAAVPLSPTVLLACAAACALAAQALGRACPVPPAPAPLPRSPRALALAAFALSAIGFWSLAPLFGYDAFLYHLPIAEHVARTGHLPVTLASVFDLPDGYPPLCYLANGALWLLAGVREHVSVRLLGMAFNLGFVMLIASEAGLAAALLAAAAPAYVEFLHAIGTDLPMACLSLIWAFRARAYLEHRRAGDAVLATLALALSLWTKYQALTLWAAGLAGLLAVRAPRALFAGQTLALAAFLPFLARNALTFANPVFPAGGHGIDPWLLEHFAAHVRAGAGLDLLLSGLLWLGLCPALWLLFVSKPSTRSDRFLRVTCWTAVLLWLALWVRPASMPGRFLLPVLGLAAALIAPHWLELERSPRDSPHLLRLAACLLLAQALWIGWGRYQEPPQKSAYRAVAFVIRDGHPGLLALALLVHRARATLTTRRALVATLALPLVFQCLDKERWLVQKLVRHGWVAQRSFDPDRVEYPFLAALPAGSRVLAVGGLPDLLPRDVVHFESLAQRDLVEASTPAAARAALARRGITHVFIDEVVAASMPVYQHGALRESLAAAERLLHEPNRMSVYRLR